MREIDVSLTVPLTAPDNPINFIDLDLDAIAASIQRGLEHPGEVDVRQLSTDMFGVTVVWHDLAGRGSAWFHYKMTARMFLDPVARDAMVTRALNEAGARLIQELPEGPISAWQSDFNRRLARGMLEYIASAQVARENPDTVSLHGSPGIAHLGGYTEHSAPLRPLDDWDVEAASILELYDVNEVDP